MCTQTGKGLLYIDKEIKDESITMTRDKKAAPVLNLFGYFSRESPGTGRYLNDTWDNFCYFCL